MRLILASSSKRRLNLLQSINIHPDQIISPDIDETPFKRESSDKLALRLAASKARAIAAEGDAYIIAADTIVGTKTRIFNKAESFEDVEKYLKFFSGRRIYIKTAVAVIKIVNSEIEKIATSLVISKVKFKRISPTELNNYLNSGNGIGAAGGLSIQGIGETLISEMTGSYSGIVGLPLNQTVNLLNGLGYDCFKSKS